MKKYTFHISGTTCNSCKMFVEDTTSKIPGITQVHVDIHTGIATFSGEIMDESSLLVMLNKSMEGKRYVFSVDKIVEEKKKSNDIWFALLFGIVFLVLFFVLQKSGILNFGIGGKITPITSFLVGVVASLSSCLAVVGGLVLSLSAKIAEDGVKVKKSLTLFHIGRIIGFAFLGGLLSLLGGALGVNYVLSGILGLIASFIMILLGINLLGFIKKNTFTLPTSLFSFFKRAERGAFAPLIVGVGTFFLPCGFTQSMQISALSSGSFISGLLIMLFFAIGTFPMLALVSFGATSIAKGKYSSIFFKSVGVIVFGLGVFGFLAGLAGLGIINPLFTL